MSITVNQKIEKLSPDRREKVEARAAQLLFNTNYLELKDAVELLAGSNKEDDFYIDQAVAFKAYTVIDALYNNDIPCPRIGTHGKDSVILIWGETRPELGWNNLYLTISTDSLSLLKSSKSKIDYRKDAVPLKEAISTIKTLTV